jgi:hypothetical protein
MVKKQSVKKICFEINPISKWIPSFVIFAINLYLFSNFPLKNFWGDSLSNYVLSDTFIINGQFSLFNFQNSLRSFLLPLLLWIPRLFSMLIREDAVTSFRIFSAFLSALTTAILFPLFFEEVFIIRTKPLSRLLFAGLITFFWFGHLSYPLSDFPALTFFVMGIVLCIKAFKFQSSIWLTGGMALMAGILLGGTPLLRLNYQYSFHFFLVFALIKLMIRKISLRNKLVLGGLLIIGISIPLSIQTSINKIHYDVYSPYPLAKMSPELNSVSVYLYALYYGLNLQRADFGGEVGADSVLIPETQGQVILTKHKIQTLDGFTMSKYLKLVICHPLDFMAIYARHLFNGIDIVYPSTYIPDIFRHQMFYRFFNYTFWFLSLSLIWRRGIQFNQDKEKLFILFIVILPALLTIPGVIETRYFLPAYILMYACISFWFCSNKEYFRDLLAFQTVIAYVCFMMICYAFSSLLFSMKGIILN